MNQTDLPVIADDKQIAKITHMSLPWVRKDRATKRILPFFRIGRAIRYNVPVVLAALSAHMEGGKR